jgi:hypothetical protein
MLSAFGKLQSQINGIAEGLQFQGSWNASTNTPTLTSSTGTQGHYYIVGVAGSTNLDGITDWEVGDWAIFSTTGVWQRLDQTGVQGTGTTGNLTKWATGSTIADSIISESGSVITITGSQTVNGISQVGSNGNGFDFVAYGVTSGKKLNWDSLEDTLIIDGEIDGSAVLDDDTFATATNKTVATSESIKAYVDAQNQGSGTVGTIAKFATSTTFNNSVITQSSTDLFLGGETYIPSHQLIIGASDQNFSSEYLILDGSGTHTSTNNTILSRQRGLNIGTVEAESVNIDTTNQTRLTISSGGTATFYGNLIANSNLGVNASDPVKTLDVRGQLAISNSSTSYYYIDRNDTDGNFEIKNDSDSNLLTISSGGNVGIGSSPTSKLNVVDSANGAAIKISGAVTDTSASYYGFMHDGTDLQGATQVNMFYSGGAIKSGVNIADFASFRIDAPSIGGGSISNNYAIYQASSAQKNYFGGNVGIGGTPPSISGYTSLAINNATNGAILDLEQGDAMKARFIATSTTATIETGSGIPFAIDVNGNGSSDLSISTGGLVGIGVTPEELLDVYTSGADPTSILQIRANRTGYGNIRTKLKTYAGGSSATNKFAIDFEGTEALTIASGGDATFSNNLFARRGSFGTASNFNFDLYNNGTSYFNGPVTIDDNVGIGTSSPDDVNGTSLSPHTNLQVFSTSNAAHLIVNGGVNGSLLLNDSSASANSRLWRVMSDGGVFSINALTDAAAVKHNTLEISEGGTVAIYGAASSSHQFLIHGFDNGTNFNTFSQNLSGQELFGVRNNGEFQTGQATNSPANNSTTGSGNCFINAAGTLVTTSSSKKFKNTITDATHGLSDVLKLRSVTYKSNNTKIDGDKTFGGFIAEEVHDIGLTEFVHYDTNDEPKSLHYANMVSLLTKAIQEQQGIIDSLTARLDALEKKV